MIDKKIAYITLGCKLNYAETSTYERGFSSHGLSKVKWSEQADIYLINTCTVTQHSDTKCRNIIRKCHRISPDASIIVTGCYAELKRDEISNLDGVKLVFGAKEKTKIVSQTMALLQGEDVTLDQSYKERTLLKEYKEISKDTLAAFSTGERTRAFLKVQDGCNNFCSYCTIPFARGNSRNIPINEVVAQAHEIAKTGIKEIVLTGVNTGDFGRTTNESFLDLLKALNEVEGIERYRISSIEPNLITEEIVDWIATGTKILPHFHIPLQVGTNEMLKIANRKYSIELFEEKINYIREKLEGKGKSPVFFGIDMIVGLPGETDELFEQSYNFLVEKIQPAFIHIFPYSQRNGTKASLMPDQVQDSKKKERVKRLEEVCEKLNSSFVAANKGLKEEVLWESSQKNGKMFGYTRNYIRIEDDFDPKKVGTIEQIII